MEMSKKFKENRMVTNAIEIVFEIISSQQEAVKMTDEEFKAMLDHAQDRWDFTMNEYRNTVE